MAPILILPPGGLSMRDMTQFMMSGPIGSPASVAKADLFAIAFDLKLDDEDYMSRQKSLTGLSLFGLVPIIGGGLTLNIFFTPIRFFCPILSPPLSGSETVPVRVRVRRERKMEETEAKRELKLFGPVCLINGFQ